MNGTPTPRRPRTAAHLTAVLVVLLLTPVLLGACGGSSMSTPGATAATAAAANDVPDGMMDDGFGGAMTPVDRAAWNTRPDFVSLASRNTQIAYAFAVEHPDVLQWLPCYCGCAGMGHRSNLDCFVQRHDASGVAFEEHASACDVCVKTATMAKVMRANGSSLLEIRQAVDRTFGGNGAPGTDTPMPAA
jgi:hypothetical protein